MMCRLRFLLPALTLAAMACGGDEAPEMVVDFSGTWQLRADFIYQPEDVICVVNGLTLTVVQDGSFLSGSATAGTMLCSQSGVDWPAVVSGEFTLSGNARPASVIFNLQEVGGPSLTFSGPLTDSKFNGAFQGSLVLEPFNLGDVAVSGTWTASR